MTFGIKLSLSVCSNAGETSQKGELSKMSWAKKALSKLANKEAEKKEEDRIWSLRQGRIRSEAPLLWESLKQELRTNIEEFNRGRTHYFRTQPAGIAGDFESHQVSSPKGNVTLRFYGSIPKLIVEVYRAQAPSIEEMLTDKSEFSFVFHDDAVWFAEIEF